MDTSQRFNIGAELIERNLRAGRGEAPAILSGGKILTYRDLEALTDRLAAAFLRAGVEPEQRVLFVLPDSPQLAARYLAAVKIGAVAVPSNPLLRPADYTYLVVKSAALLRAIRAGRARPLLERPVLLRQQAVPRLRAGERAGVSPLGGREHGAVPGPACARPRLSHDRRGQADGLLRRAHAIRRDARAEGGPTRPLLAAPLRLRRRAAPGWAVHSLEVAVRDRDPRRHRLHRGAPHLRLAPPRPGETGLDRCAGGRIRGEDHR